MSWQNWRNTAQLKFLVEKLRNITLSSAPLVEIDPKLSEIFTLWRRQSNNTISEDEAVGEYARLKLDTEPLPPMFMVWEPLSDAGGDKIDHKGWFISTTLFLWHGQPWWMLTGTRAKKPTPAAEKALDEIIKMIGGDPTRDLLLALPGEDGAEWSIRFAWPHVGNLLEMHIRTTPFAVKVVPEGTPVEVGFERQSRITQAEIAAERKGKAN